MLSMIMKNRSLLLTYLYAVIQFDYGSSISNDTFYVGNHKSTLRYFVMKNKALATELTSHRFQNYSAIDCKCLYMKARRPPLRVIQRQEREFFEHNFKSSDIFGFSYHPDGVCLLVDAKNPLTPGKDFKLSLLMEETLAKEGAKTVVEVLRDTPFVYSSEETVFFESKERMDLEDCFEFCSALPGFRLAQPKTKATLNDARQFSRHYLDLKAVKASGFSYDSLVWGDGTVLDTSILLGNGTEEPVKNNEDVENMSMWGGKLDDIKEDEKASCLCQNT